MLHALCDVLLGVVDRLWDGPSVWNEMCECESCGCTYNDDYMVVAMFGGWSNGSPRITAYIGSWSTVVCGGSMGGGVKLGHGTGLASDDSIC